VLHSFLYEVDPDTDVSLGFDLADLLDHASVPTVYRKLVKPQKHFLEPNYTTQGACCARQLDD